VAGFESSRYRVIASGADSGAAIIIVNPRLEVLRDGKYTEKYTAVANLSWQGRSLTMVSSYFKYSLPPTSFIIKLRGVLDSRNGETLIGADTNGHSLSWHCESANARGKLVEEMVDDCGLVTHNKQSNLKTYERPGMGASNVDVTFTTVDISHRVKEWRVADETDSDHRLLIFKLSGVTKQKSTDRLRFNVKLANWDVFRLELGRECLACAGDLHERAARLTSAIIAASKKAIPVKSQAPLDHRGGIKSLTRLGVSFSMPDESVA